MFQEGENRLSRTWIIFFERLASARRGLAVGAGGELKATFGLVRALTVEDDLTNHFICRTGGDFKILAVNAKDPPTGTVARIEIEVSSNEGSNWNTICSAPGYIELDIGDGGLQEFTECWESAYRTIAVDYLLRINCVQIGSTIAGKNIEFVLLWE